MERGYKIIEGFAETQRRDEVDNDMDTMHTAVIVIEKFERRTELLKRDLGNHGELEYNNDNNKVVKRCQAQKVKLSALKKTLLKAYKALDD